MDQRKLRKYEYNLVISGAGIIVFGAWSIIKAVMFFAFTPMDVLAQSITQEQKEMYGFGAYSNESLAYYLLAAVLLNLILGLAIRYYIGRAAIRDGRRIRKQRPVYIVLAVLVSISLIMSTVTRFTSAAAGEVDLMSSFDKSYISVFVDATSLLCLIEMIVSAIMVRRLRREAD